MSSCFMGVYKKYNYITGALSGKMTRTWRLDLHVLHFLYLKEWQREYLKNCKQIAMHGMVDEFGLGDFAKRKNPEGGGGFSFSYPDV